MSASQFDVYYPLLRAKFQQNAVTVTGWAGLGALGLALLLAWPFLFPDSMPKMPIAMEEEIPNKKKRQDIYMRNTRELLMNGYKKFGSQVFGLTTTEGTNIVIPLGLLDGLGGQKSLSFSAFLEEEFSFKKYTKVGNLKEIEINIVNKKLNPSLPQYVPVIQQVARDHWPLDDYQDFTAIKPYPHIMRLVSRVSARIFHSAEAAENDHWLDISTQHVNSAVLWTETLKKWPHVLRPVVYPFVNRNGRQTMLRHFDEAKSMVAETLRKRRTNGDKHLDNPPSLLDWLAESDMGAEDAEAHTITQINLIVAAIQSMAATVTQCLMDMATYPEYISELRQEIEEKLAKGNGHISRQALSEMLKLDSFIKETQRLNPPDLTSFQRKAVSELTLSNGMRVPKGARIVLPTGAINMDEGLFENPQTFDGFRYHRLRTEREGMRNSYQMVTVGKKDLTWGYGRHACPGRYIAEVALKLLLIEFITRYDVRLPIIGGGRPKNIEFEGLVIPDPEWEIMFCSRGAPLAMSN
ncbi:Cytochrome p450 [Pleurostoma richardsiae]|uniref:Cytochrome p450 n=1 Tax=Pleurostoma richardsiae TaxID=41990 RepID=A0AA38RXW2_9PEZI|nr:Cytochrome p450 [Pleurostoma richardsiae]